MTGPVYNRYGITVHHGDNLDVMRGMADASVHSIVTDPPAGIRFMNRAWDSDMGGRHSWVEWLTERMREAHRVLKPGGYGLVWAMPRTSHWTAWALEDAGFEIRDCVVHLFGAGFPKSLDVSKAIDKAAGAERAVIGLKPSNRPNVIGARPGGSMGGGDYTERVDTAPATVAAHEWSGFGTALKPAAEHWWLIRKPMAGTVAQNVQEHGVGALNIDACRVAHASASDLAESVNKNRHAAFNSGPTDNKVYGKFAEDRGDYDGSQGRWPSNVVLTHGDCDRGCDESCPVAELDAQSGILTTNPGTYRRQREDATGERSAYAVDPHEGHVTSKGDSGGASRFFATFRWEAKAPTSQRPKVDGKAHPTVKPLDLMRWMVRLVCPPGGTVLDLFAGTGTTGHAARAEGMRAVLIEQDADHIPLIVSRLDGYRPPAPRDEETGQDEPVDLLDLLNGEAAS